ncbi:hypothetical protein SETIT_4G187700v2 [Setaria italica]|uniref:tRNA-splicing endonuclease subunit Sen54 N-terminal domain-containing protein n=1 Tax=Setaria italica TaxID=4555 RepID=A0A368QVP8_SETIT|nr:hypothetical protein SETIT_4G187700v2 [Setaria italica]
MRTAGNRRRRSRAPAGGAAAFAGNDDGEEQHLNPFLDAAPSASSRVQFRNVASRARWVEEAGVAEVVESKGKLWLTTGVTRGAKLCYNVEEIGNKPPSRVELETVEYNFGGIPLKYCHVDNGRASFVSLDKVALPSLP